MQRPKLPRLARDPDAQLVRWGWIAWALASLYLVVRYHTLGTGGGLVFLSGVQIAALWILWPLWRGGRALWTWVRTARHAAWNGRYYEFDGRQVRVLVGEDIGARDGATLWVVAADVFTVLGLDGRAIDAPRVRAVAGRDGLVKLRGARDLVFSERGLDAWLDRRRDDKAVAFKRWFATQVVAPYRRRRERDGL